MLYNYGIRYILLPLLLVAFVIGCGSKTPESLIPEEAKNVSKDAERTRELNRKIAEEAFSQSVFSDYKIGPGDLLEVKVYEADDLSDLVRVNSAGKVTYPLLGEVDLGELTTQEAEERLQELLEAKYIKDPHVSIFIKEYKSKRVAVVGAVSAPGTYEVLNQGRILDVLAAAGGLSGEAGKAVYLTRRGEEGQLEIDLNELLAKGNIELNLPVQMGDTVFVPQAGTYYINGAVERPGTFRLKDEITITQALEIAGGLSSGASGAKLLRYQDGEREVVPLDVKAIQKGEQKDIALKDQDVLYVGKNPLIAIFQSLRFGLRAFPFIITGGI